MITIKQTYTRIEDGHGVTEVVFVVSDTHLGLFAGDSAHIDSSGLSGSYSAGYTINSVAITGISQVAECVITLAGHGYDDGDIITIAGTVNAEWDAVFANKSFVVSESTTDTFKITNGNIDVDLFAVGDVTEKISDKIGGLISSSLAFEINEFNILTSTDLAAVNFIMQSIDPAILRYCGLFFDPISTTRAQSESRFLGVIQPNIDDEALVWKSLQWASNTGGVWLRKLTAEPIATDFFDSILIKDLILGSEDETVPGISAAWETENVIDRQGWFERYDGAHYRRTAIYQIVNFNTLLRIIADNLQTALINKEMGSYNIVYDKAELDGKYIPTRWGHNSKEFNNQTRYPRFPDLGLKYEASGTTRNAAYKKYADDATKLVIHPDANSPVFIGNGLNDLTAKGDCTAPADTTIIVEIDSEGAPDTFKWSYGVGWTTGIPITGGWQTLAVGLSIKFAATTGHTLTESWTFTALSSYNTVWLNYNTIKLNTSKETDAEKAKEFVLSENDDISFVEYIAGVAQFFGMFVKFYYSDANTLHIQFIGRQSFDTVQCYVRDAEKATRKLTGEIKDSDRYKGFTSYLAEEGDRLNSNQSFYTKRRTEQKAIVIDDNGIKVTENKAWFTLSPCFAVLEDEASEAPIPPNTSPWSLNVAVKDDNCWCQRPSFPHGHYAKNDNSVSEDFFLRLGGLHTGIFMYVDKRTDLATEFFTEAAGHEPNSYWTPAASMIIQIDGVDREFNKMSDYLNLINGRDVGYYKSEITLDIPLWNGFSVNSDGSSQGWNNLAIGKIIELDGLFYSITEIKFKGDTPSTSLNLQASGRFSDIGEAVAPTITQITVPAAGPALDIPVASGDLFGLNIVKQNADGTISVAQHTSDENGKIVGICLTDIPDGDPAIYISGGIIENFEWEEMLGVTINPGDTITLKTMVTGLVNIELNGQFTTGELWCRIGYFIDNTKLKIDIKQLIVD